MHVQTSLLYMTHLTCYGVGVRLHLLLAFHRTLLLLLGCGAVSHRVPELETFVDPPGEDLTQQTQRCVYVCAMYVCNEGKNRRVLLCVVVLCVCQTSK